MLVELGASREEYLGEGGESQVFALDGDRVLLGDLAQALHEITGPGTPPRTRPKVCNTLLLVRSGFCSEPDSANSLAMMLRLSTNQE